jgi:mannitol 2-dehydrogenase
MILSCDNLSRITVTSLGRRSRRSLDRRGAELARYVETSCTFPNSMVDRITPQKKDDDRAWLRDEVGVDDGGPVVCESFPQWVIEDRFILLQLVAASARD